MSTTYEKIDPPLRDLPPEERHARMRSLMALILADSPRSAELLSGLRITDHAAQEGGPSFTCTAVAGSQAAGLRIVLNWFGEHRGSVYVWAGGEEYNRRGRLYPCVAAAVEWLSGRESYTCKQKSPAERVLARAVGWKVPVRPLIGDSAEAYYGLDRVTLSFGPSEGGLPVARIEGPSGVDRAVLSAYDTAGELAKLISDRRMVLAMQESKCLLHDMAGLADHVQGLGEDWKRLYGGHSRGYSIELVRHAHSICLTIRKYNSRSEGRGWNLDVTCPRRLVAPEVLCRLVAKGLADSGLLQGRRTGAGGLAETRTTVQTLLRGPACKVFWDGPSRYHEVAGLVLQSLESAIAAAETTTITANNKEQQS